MLDGDAEQSKATALNQRSGKGHDLRQCLSSIVTEVAGWKLPEMSPASLKFKLLQ